MNHEKHIVAACLAVGAFFTALLPDLNEWLKFISLVIGITVGLMSLREHYKNWRK